MQAYSPVSSRFVIALCAALAFVSCDWQPLARPVQPELVLAGDYAIVGKLDATDRYVLVKTVAEAPRFQIVDLHLRTACDLPEATQEAGSAVTPPLDAGKDVPPFLIALEVKGDDGANELYTSTPDCQVAGPFGAIGSGPWIVTLDTDKRGFWVHGNGRGKLSRFDPWSQTGNVIAPNITSFSQAARVSGKDGPVGPQAFWTIDGGVLHMRDLDGEILVTLGKSVTTFYQATFDSVRIAYVDGENVYEASGPNFEPFLVAEGGCQPFYYGTTLNLYSPCSPPQLVRLDLVTGTIQEFPDGVTWSYTDSNVLLEYALLGTEEVLYATPSRGTRTQVTPTLYDVHVIDNTRVAGTTADRRFGVWNVNGGFTSLFEGVVKLSPFIDVRKSNFLWLMLHDENMGIGRLSVIDQNTFKLLPLAENVPKGLYSVEYLESVPEPIVVSVEDVAQGAAIGDLRARFLSGELPSSIDQNVSSYRIIAAPLPGLLYTTTEGPEHGLWFAAL